MIRRVILYQLTNQLYFYYKAKGTLRKQGAFFHIYLKLLSIFLTIGFSQDQYRSLCTYSERCYNDTVERKIYGAGERQALDTYTLFGFSRKKQHLIKLVDAIYFSINVI